jgi:hypothetical protein
VSAVMLINYFKQYTEGEPLSTDEESDLFSAQEMAKHLIESFMKSEFGKITLKDFNDAIKE